MNITRIIRRPFTAVDTAWLHMDNPTNLSLICGVITFEEPLDFNRLCKTLDDRLNRYPRFKQRVREYRIGPPFWEFDENYNIKNHLYSVSLPDPANHVTLQQMVSEMMSQPLDFSKPLWELIYVNNYEDRSALICRFHHCLADGIALVQVLLSATDFEPNPQPKGYVEDDAYSIDPLVQIFVPVVKFTRGLQKKYISTRKFLSYGFDVVTHPTQLLPLVSQGLAGGEALGKLLLMPPDPKTILKEECGIPKKAVWSKSVKISDVKKVGQVRGATVNDVLMTSITGAIQRYLFERGEDVHGLNIRAIIPVNLSANIDLDNLGNNFGLVFLSLPMDIEDPAKRLIELKSRMDRIKLTPEAVVAFGILNFMGISPTMIEDLIRDMFGEKGSVVITNVPGPDVPLYLAGGKIDGIMFWVPTPANLSIGISILSYAGDVIIGVAVDEGIIPDPERIIQGFTDEFNSALSMVDNGESNASPSTFPPTGVGKGDHQTDWTGQSPEMDQEPHQQSIPEPIHPELDRCLALTKKGERCKNQPLPGSQYCRVHTTG